MSVRYRTSSGSHATMTSTMFRRTTIGLSGLVTVLAVAHALAADCTCKDARRHGGWCNECDVGYVAAVRIESADLFEALDAHGHQIDPKRIECSSCQEGLKSDGFCDRCSMGFVEKQAYLSRLTYHLALGKQIAEADIACKVCKELAGKTGWCKKCRRGWIGFVSIDHKKDYDQAAKAYAILVAAVKMLQKCDTCAVAMVPGARCPSCNVFYKDGQPTEPPNRTKSHP